MKTLSTYATYGFAWAATVSVLYLWGFWSAFEVNITQYLTLSDVIASAAYPITIVGVWLLTGLLLGEPKRPEPYPVGSLRGKALLFSVRVLTAAFIPICCAIVWLVPSAYKWQGIGFLALILVASHGAKHGIWEKIFPFGSLSSSVAILLLGMLSQAFPWGRLAADKILSEESYIHLGAPVPGLPPGVDLEKTKYLGQAGSYVFILMPDNYTIFVATFESLQPLLLQKRHAKAPTYRPFRAD